MNTNVYVLDIKHEFISDIVVGNGGSGACLFVLCVLC